MRHIPLHAAEVMGLSRGLRNFEAGGACERKVDGLLKRDTVAHADEDGLGIVSRSHGGTHEVATMCEGHVGSPHPIQLFEITHEFLLCDAKSGRIERDAEVARETESPRMGEALSVGHEDIRPNRQLRKRLYDGGDLSKAEQAGYVGKGDVAFPSGMIYHCQIRQRDDRDPALRRIILVTPPPEADVHARNGQRRPLQGLLLHRRGEAILDPDGLLRRNIPFVGVVKLELHRTGPLTHRYSR